MKEGKWLKKRFMGTELHGKVLGLVGIGRIGAAVTERARAFGMDVVAYDPYLTEEQVASHGARKVELDELLAMADFISIHVPLLPSTKRMFDREKFRRMKSTAYIINCSRGGVIDETALVWALREGEIAGAGLDVFENEAPSGEILDAPNTVFTPHLGASTWEGQRRAGIIVAEQVMKVLKGEKPDFQVNRF